MSGESLATKITRRSKEKCFSGNRSCSLQALHSTPATGWKSGPLLQQPAEARLGLQD